MNITAEENLENQLAGAKELIARSEAARRLYNNADFRMLIIDGFMRDDAARLVAESADPVLDAAQRADALAMAQAGGHLRRFLSVIMQMGNTSLNELPQIEEALAEVRSQGDTDAASAVV